MIRGESNFSLACKQKTNIDGKFSLQLCTCGCISPIALISLLKYTIIHEEKKEFKDSIRTPIVRLVERAFTRRADAWCSALYIPTHVACLRYTNRPINSARLSDKKNRAFLALQFNRTDLPDTATSSLAIRKLSAAGGRSARGAG